MATSAAMNEPSPIPRVLASPMTALLSVLGMLALVAAARDVPQGLDASGVLESFGRGTGPFIVLLGLHRLGESFFLWAAIVLLALHLMALRLQTGPDALPGTPWRLLPVIFLLPLLPLSQRWIPSPDPLRDPIRLSVWKASGVGTPYKVEEGATYRLPGVEGSLLFATLSFGPWAGETTADGSLRVHLPVPVRAEDSPTFQVSARRPPVIDSWQPFPDAVLPLHGVSLAASLLAALVCVLGMAFPSPDPGVRGARIGVIAAIALVLLTPLWLHPDGPRLPLVSRASGASLLFGGVIRTPQDVAPWIGAIPVRFPASRAAPLLWGSLAALALLAWYRLLRPCRGTRRPDRLVRVVAAALGLGGLVLAATAVLRLPLSLTQDSLARWLDTRYLALVPSSWSVLETSLSAPGPWALSWTSLTLHAVTLLTLGGSLWALAAPPREGKPHLPLAPLAIALAALALLQAVGSLALVPSGLLPEAALPSSLLVALLALLAFGLGPTSSLSAGQVCLTAACLLQMSLVL